MNDSHNHRHTRSNKLNYERCDPENGTEKETKRRKLDIKPKCGRCRCKLIRTNPSHLLMRHRQTAKVDWFWNCMTFRTFRPAHNSAECYVCTLYDAVCVSFSLCSCYTFRSISKIKVNSIAVVMQRVREKGEPRGLIVRILTTIFPVRSLFIQLRFEGTHVWPMDGSMMTMTMYWKKMNNKYYSRIVSIQWIVYSRIIRSFPLR